MRGSELQICASRDAAQAFALKRRGALARILSMVERFLAIHRPVEIASIIYLKLLNAIILAFRDNLPTWGYLFWAHEALIAIISLFASLAHRSRRRAVLFVRSWYPVLLFVGLFEEIEHIVHVIFPGWFDWILIDFDYALFGVHPAVWLERYANVWLNEYMQFAYTSYFFLLPILGSILYCRKQWHRFDELMLSTAIAYYLCYLVFLVFPTEGPYHTLKSLQGIELEGRYFTALINWIESYGRVHGGAFPSAHVAGSFVVLICAHKFERRLFWALLPIVLSLFVSTVYGRYHYASDVLAGLLVGWAGVKLGVMACRAYERKLT